MEHVQSPEGLFQVLEKLNENISSLSNSASFAAARPQLLVAIRNLYYQLETPIELSRRLGWQEPAHVAAMKVAVDLRLFEHLETMGPGGGLSSAELARASGGHEELIARTMRILVVQGVVHEVDVDRFAPTPKSTAFIQPKVYSGIEFWFHITSKSLANLPKFLRERGYDALSGPESEGNWASATGSNKGIFGWLHDHPEALRAFANHMASFSEDRANWVDIYPVQEKLLDGAEPSGPLLVDVGGSLGHDVRRLQEKYHQPPGRLYVQDRAEVVEEARKSSRDSIIEFQIHDFNEMQPIKGARAYFMHSILHDWSDEVCLNILAQLKPAMKPGYSKILVADFVVASRNVDRFCATVDYTVMAALGSKERTEEAWKHLFHRAGLRVSGIWSAPTSGDSVIEVVLDGHKLLSS